MGDPYIGEIRAFAFGFTPREWLPCDGSKQSIHEFPALYTVIGTLFGGDGTSIFNLPDLRARAVASQYTSGEAPMDAAIGIKVGAIWGANAVILGQPHTPVHTHVAKGYGSTSGVAQVETPDNTTYLGLLRSSSPIYAYDIWSSNAASGSLAPQMVGMMPGNGTAPHNNNQPYLPLNFCICYNGNYPVRP